VEGHLSFPVIDRWVRWIVVVVTHDQDVTTLADWSTVCHVSSRTMNSVCRVVAVTSRNSLLLARLLRGARLATAWNCRIMDLLDLQDPRTVTRIAKQTGIDLTTADPDAPLAVLAKQQLIKAPVLLERLEQSVRLIVRTEEPAEWYQRTEGRSLPEGLPKTQRMS
jgi:hypothetical protein